MDDIIKEVCVEELVRVVQDMSGDFIVQVEFEKRGDEKNGDSIQT